ncbi:hypothetical protein [Brevibacillus reuszeri]
MDKYWYRTKKQEKLFFRKHKHYVTGMDKEHNIIEISLEQLTGKHFN